MNLNSRVLSQKNFVISANLVLIVFLSQYEKPCRIETFRFLDAVLAVRHRQESLANSTLG